MINTKLKPYMANERHESAEGAILVFAHTVKEAKKVAWNTPSFLQDCCDCEYINLEVTLIKDGKHLFAEGNREKLEANEPHIVECPESCKGCELWGNPLDEDGYCEDCRDNKNEWDGV